MINVYGMTPKADAHKAYQDFLREEGIPVTLHRDNAGEQNDTRFKSTNRDLLVKDTTTELYHPHQNPAEARAIRFLKHAGKSLIAMSGAPAKTWFYAMKYVAQINNWTSHESLDWKTPHKKRHGTQPDISPLLAYKFYQPVYYYVQEGFPNSGEKLGYVLGVNKNVGSHMTFDLLTDNKQTVITRSMLRAIVEPTPNLRIEATEELNPAVRIRYRDEAVEEATTEAQRENAELDGLVLGTGADTAVLGPPPLIDRTMDDFNPQELEEAFRQQMERGELRARPLEEPPAVEPLFNDVVMDDNGIGAADLQIFVDEPLPMHQCRQRKKKHEHEKPTRSPTQGKHKHSNICSNKRHAPSNKKRTRKVKRQQQQQQQEPSRSHIIERKQDDESQEFVIENILQHRRNKDNGTFEVLVSWEGYDSDEDTWERNT